MKLPIIKIGTWWFLPKDVLGITLFPWVLLDKRFEKYNEEHQNKTMNHETIHFRQQIETLVLFFYLWYGLEYIIKFFKYGANSYYNLSFEREAFDKDDDLNYLKTRKFWAFLKYL